MIFFKKNFTIGGHILKSSNLGKFNNLNHKDYNQFSKY
jgi:hypothetical protein